MKEKKFYLLSCLCLVSSIVPSFDDITRLIAEEEFLTEEVNRELAQAANSDKYRVKSDKLPGIYDHRISPEDRSSLNSSQGLSDTVSSRSSGDLRMSTPLPGIHDQKRPQAPKKKQINNSAKSLKVMKKFKEPSKEVMALSHMLSNHSSSPTTSSRDSKNRRSSVSSTAVDRRDEHEDSALDILVQDTKPTKKKRSKSSSASMMGRSHHGSVKVHTAEDVALLQDLGFAPAPPKAKPSPNVRLRPAATILSDDYDMPNSRGSYYTNKERQKAVAEFKGL